jgi:hypothetical protein
MEDDEHRIELEMPTGRGQDARLLVDGRNFLREVPVREFTLKVERSRSYLGLELAPRVPTRFVGEASVEARLPSGWVEYPEPSNEHWRWVRHLGDSEDEYGWGAIGVCDDVVELRDSGEIEQHRLKMPVDALRVVLFPGLLKLRDSVQEAAREVVRGVRTVEGKSFVTVDADLVDELRRRLGEPELEES